VAGAVAFGALRSSLQGEPHGGYAPLAAQCARNSAHGVERRSRGGGCVLDGDAGPGRLGEHSPLRDAAHVPRREAEGRGQDSLRSAGKAGHSRVCGAQGGLGTKVERVRASCSLHEDPSIPDAMCGDFRRSSTNENRESVNAGSNTHHSLVKSFEKWFLSLVKWHLP
jgi:hypothetical protein